MHPLCWGHKIDGFVRASGPGTKSFHNRPKMFQEDIAPVPGFPHDTGLLLAALNDSTREWRENLGEPPVEALVWQPAPKSYSIGAVILHIIDCEVGWFEGFIGGKPNDPDQDRLLMSEEVQQYDGLWPAPPAQPISWYYELHDRFRERAWEALEGIEPDRYFSDGKEVESTLRWVVSHIVQHDSYHGGQAVLLHELWKKLVGSVP